MSHQSPGMDGWPGLEEPILDFFALATLVYCFFTLTDWCRSDLLKADLLISEPVGVILPALRLFGEGKSF